MRWRLWRRPLPGPHDERLSPYMIGFDREVRGLSIAARRRLIAQYIGKDVDYVHDDGRLERLPAGWASRNYALLHAYEDACEQAWAAGKEAPRIPDPCK